MKVEDGEIKVSILHFGLGIAYFSDESGKKAGYMLPGAKAIWITALNSGTLSITSGVTFTTDANYRPLGSGDFNADGQTDIVAEQITSSTVSSEAMARKIMFMNGTTYSSEHTFLTWAQEWRIRGVKDFDGNGTPDMLIEQDYSGRRGVWYMTGQTLTEGFIFTTVAPEWQLSLQ